jgi:hypothetical protein
MTLNSAAEQKAEAAQNLTAFQDVNLQGIKAKVAQILSLIGRDGLFTEYTLHDISHVDQMLASLDWLIPKQTMDAMTPADWLLIVLAIYFHDAGLLVTKQEFQSRDGSGFPAFCIEELFSGDDGQEYQSKVAALGAEASAKFLYEDYVRHNHATRIADWITGRASAHLGVTAETAKEVSDALAGLPDEFCADLALVCQSHHLSDLGNLSKYKTSQPYGNSNAETANVQYAALILRCADLLHMTSDRTPSVMFRLVDPQDPISQREWAKQQAVRSVRPQKGRDREGNFNDSAQRDTIEVFASFDEASAFLD